MACSWDKVTFGATGLRVSPLAIGSSYGVGAGDIERAFERSEGALSSYRLRFDRYDWAATIRFATGDAPVAVVSDADRPNRAMRRQA